MRCACWLLAVEMVHARQRMYLAEHVQQRMAESAQPLSELYSATHAFCVALTMRTLHHQTNELIASTWGQSLKPNYVADSSLAIRYWARSGIQASEVAEDACSCLQIVHVGDTLRVVHQPTLYYNPPHNTDPTHFSIVRTRSLSHSWASVAYGSVRVGR